MSFSLKLWQVAEDGGLKSVPKSVLDKEARLEEWVRKDPSLLGMDVLIIGQQVVTPNGGRIDLLALDANANLVVLELKRDKTPREVVAQVLDYGAYIRNLSFNEIDEIARSYVGTPVADAYAEHFGEPLGKINQSHQLIILASELDESSEQIVEYLTEAYQVPINAIFFTFFKTAQGEFLGRAWLMDPEEVQERAVSNKQAPWSGYYFVNVGEGEHRNWDDCRKYGFLAAGHGPKYSRSLRKLNEGDLVFAYMKQLGYVGFGKVTKPAASVNDFVVDKLGKKILELPLTQPNLSDMANDEEDSEWAVGIEWKKTFSRDEAKWFKDAFANQNIVCKLRDPATVTFLKNEFVVE
jgi:hypothetical protein